MKSILPILLVAVALLAMPGSLSAQRSGPPRVVSPEVPESRELIFRLMAPKAESVKLAGSDIPGLGQGREMIRGTNGIWEVKLGPVPPGSYRYHFNVDGATVLDPRNPAVSQSNENPWSLVHVPGSDWQDVGDVPHGAVSEVTYWSGTLKRFRRFHVYTPPGYESGDAKYPVFYLLHGASDSDDSWSTVGRAGVILDNLIASGKARPMVVVMPHGHTGPFQFGMPLTGGFEPEFMADILPTVERRYRVHTDRANRAIAGLSMGGAQALNIGVPNLGQFGYIGVYSSGIFGIVPRPGAPAPQGPTFEEQHRAILDDASLKDGLRLLWFATGKDDFLVETTRATVKMFQSHQFNVVHRETEGGHTWDKWREYLHEFAPQIFR